MEQEPPEALLCIGDDGGVDVADVGGGIHVVDGRCDEAAATLEQQRRQPHCPGLGLQT